MKAALNGNVATISIVLSVTLVETTVGAEAPPFEIGIVAPVTVSITNPALIVFPAFAEDILKAFKLAVSRTKRILIVWFCVIGKFLSKLYTPKLTSLSERITDGSPIESPAVTASENSSVHSDNCLKARNFFDFYKQY